MTANCWGGQGVRQRFRHWLIRHGLYRYNLEQLS